MATAVVSYTWPPPHGKRAGRVVDAELWAKVSPALAVSPFTEEQRQDLVDQDLPQTIAVSDARSMEPAPTLATMGFELQSSPSAVTDWQRTPETVAMLCSEAEELVKKVLPGAAGVSAFDHTWRNSLRSNFDSSIGGKSHFSSAVARVHTDFTPASSLEKVDQLIEQKKIGSEFADGARYRRAIVNVWRVYGGGDRCTAAPLAVIDPSTVAASCCFPYALVHETRAGVNGSISFDPAHKWYYFPEMRKDEALLFYNFEEGVQDLQASRCVYHAALDAAEAQNGPPPGRQSVEVRVLVLFPR
jgi:hypothetical protein